MARFLRFFLLAESVLAFSIYHRNNLPSSLGDDCADALTRDIACDITVLTFGEMKYHGSLGSVDQTKTVCSGQCYVSLRSWFNLVSDKCAGKTLDTAGTPPTLLGGYMWEGFNETCVQDSRTRRFCNDVIDQFTTVDSIQEMPRSELCHACFVRKLAMMQRSQYSAYDQVYKAQLDYVYAQCGGKGPTDILPKLIPELNPPTPSCLTDRFYTTSGGDTCESIANSTGVAGSALYIANQMILPACSGFSSGIQLCLPLPCDTFFVRPSDTCNSIETTVGLEKGKLRQYNTWLSMDCSNLQTATDYFGKNICVSPLGGTFTATRFPVAPVTPGNGFARPGTDNGAEMTGQGSSGSTRSAVRPPSGARVARGTTLRCGKWHVVAENDACSFISSSYSIEIDAFRTANPSLADGDCTSKLLRGSAVCVSPLGSVFTSTTSQIPVSPTVPDNGGSRKSAVRPPSGARVARGTTLECGKWHIVQANDACSSISSSYSIEIDTFRTANPSLADEDCTSKLLRGSAVCVSPLGGTSPASQVATTSTTQDNGVSGGNGGNGGSTLSVVRPPSGARVARGTTLRCGKWYVVRENDACSSISLHNTIRIEALRTANPSLADEDCNSKLVRGSAVCVGPITA